MSMSPITETVQGQSLTFLLTKAAMDATLTIAALETAFRPQLSSISNAIASSPGNWKSGGATSLYTAPTQAMWAGVLATGPDASTSQIPRDQVVAVLRESLIGGGMAAANAINVADTIVRNQNSRAVDYLAAQIVQAAIAAG